MLLICGWFQLLVHVCFFDVWSQNAIFGYLGGYVAIDNERWGKREYLWLIMIRDGKDF